MVEPDVGALTKWEKERLALAKDKNLDGRTERRCGIVEAGCEEGESLMILPGRRRMSRRS